jgi:hypothetical protein
MIFLEHRILGDVDVLSGGVVEVPSLAPTFIADEHHRCASVLELRQPLVPLLDMGYTTKHTKMVHIWFDPMPYLIWCAPMPALAAVATLVARDYVAATASVATAVAAHDRDLDHACHEKTTPPSADRCCHHQQS